MTTSPDSLAPPSFRRILHPTDFTPDSQTALVHAIKLAVAERGELSIMHVDPNVPRADFEDFPKVRPILTQWGLLPPDSPRERVSDIGLTINKVRTVATHPAEGILRHLEHHPADLLVMSTHQHEGFTRWHHQGVAEPVARQSQIATLFVPAHVEGFVVTDSGQPKLRRILVPVSADAHPQHAIDTAAKLAELLGCDNLTGIAVHIGEDETFLSIHYPHRAGWLWHSMTCRGPVIDVILGMGADFDVDLIVMTTAKQQSWLDMLRGSVTERVLRGARCPLLALPV